ncbi:MAG: DUF1343 domain-containing protein [Flavobacteriaceae bacterium]|nr:DUF1343 domain-containing protein [Bacteroidia bacterium]MBT8288565.1 DUF1343 domain-containing protein [Bacteroidia bacterium]NNF76126.1 DUF1343 domain-containing protein [Flavobacteriaceae bacterium]NNK71903.1 DUF1343 domain-containing protein [Flavobacteriaceae bacterium]
MLFTLVKNTLLFILIILSSCNTKTERNQSGKDPLSINDSGIQHEQPIQVGASRTEVYLPLIKGKRIGIVANQTSIITHDESNSYTHLVDSLSALKLDIRKVFAPEHGFRGTADAGEAIQDGIDTRTGLPIISLYGKNKKPSAEQLSDVDVVLFDIQDVGARFYTYISTLHYVMEACGEQGKQLIVLDRPNPNGHIIDGPVLEMRHKSFVGMHPIPILHGMTIGEYAKMINGEKWLDQGINCSLEVIPVANYDHSHSYHLPVKPSPNLPNDQSIMLYPSLCLFEGTNVSAGRGTEMQFQIFGSPFLDENIYGFIFQPEPNEGAKYPKHQGIKCYGKDLRKQEKLNKLNLNWLIDAYNSTADREMFFNDFFTKLAGTETLKGQIKSGLSHATIRASWSEGLSKFTKMREQYLIYD